MTPEQVDLQLERMHMMCKVFQSRAETETDSLPKFKASESINQILLNSEALTNKDITEILRLLATVESTKHANGSQWLDYKIHLNSLLVHHGFKKSSIF
jgi:hypothetical protein